MSKPTVSIVIATYNACAFIGETLDSILEQSYQDFELIVVDDGSVDTTCALIEKHYPRVRLFVQSNQGVCAARNKGLAESIGHYVCFVDHDDFWFPDKLAHQMAIFDADPGLGVVYSTFRTWLPGDDGGYPDPSTIARPESETALDSSYSGWIYHQLLLDCWVLTSTAMIRTEVLQELGAFDLSLPYAEDWDLWLRISREYRFAKLTRTMVMYRQHAGQGNRQYREIDYRTRLLRQAVQKWGLIGPDGTQLDRRRFLHQLGRYHVSYGLHCLHVASRLAAVRSIWKGWTCQPLRFKYLAYIAAGVLGWRPK